MALRRTELLGVKPAEAASAAVEGDFEVGVFGYFASVGAPNPVDEAARPRRGKAHLVDPNVLGKRRFRRPFLDGVQASVPPELSGFLIDSEYPENTQFGLGRPTGIITRIYNPLFAPIFSFYRTSIHIL